MIKARLALTTMLILATLLCGVGGSAAAPRGGEGGYGKGHGGGNHGVIPAPLQSFGPTVNIAPFHARVETGVVTVLSAGGFTLAIPQALPLAVTVASTTTVTAAGAPAGSALIQPGLYVRVTGTFAAATHSLVAAGIQVMLPLVQGIVQTVAANGFSMVSTRGDIVGVTTTPATKWLQTAAMRRFSRGKHAQLGGINLTTPISGTTSLTATAPLSGTAAIPAAAGPAPLAGNDRVLVEGMPGQDGASITAVRILVGVPVNAPAAMPDEPPAG